MNGEQFKSLANYKYNIESYYWAPETGAQMLEHHPKFDKKDTYQQAMIVLFQNEKAFKNRIDSNIVDNWLSANTFKPIINELILVMNDLILLYDPKLNITCLKITDWQVKLLTLFNNFKN